MFLESEDLMKYVRIFFSNLRLKKKKNTIFKQNCHNIWKNLMPVGSFEIVVELNNQTEISSIQSNLFNLLPLGPYHYRMREITPKKMKKKCKDLPPHSTFILLLSKEEQSLNQYIKQSLMIPNKVFSLFYNTKSKKA